MILLQPPTYILLELHIIFISLIIYKPSTLIIFPQTFSMWLGAGTSLFCLFQYAIPFCTPSAGTFYICTSLFYTYNIPPSIPLVSSLAFLILLHILSLYLLKPQIYFGELVFSFSFLSFYSTGLGVWTSCISNILFLTFLLTLSLIKQEHTSLWAGYSWCCNIAIETL